MGLAALTFASVAGASVSATSTNANAAKHTTKKVAKKVTYKVTNGSLDQKVVYTATGSNAVYSKPGTVKGAKVVASKATMASLANSKKASDQFMAYQEVTTSKGAKYYKVVSFDKKIRGYVYASGIQSVGTTTSDLTVNSTYLYTGSNTPSTVYLKADRLFDNPYGSVFGAKLVKYNKNVVNYTVDPFYIDGAKEVSRTGDVYYHVVDVNNHLVSGWVNSANIDTTTGNDTLYAKANAVHVSYVDSTTGKVLFTADHTYAYNGIASAINGDATKDASAKGYDLNGSNIVVDGLVKNSNDFSSVKNGSNVTFFVSTDASANQTQQVKLHFMLVTKNNDGSVVYSDADSSVSAAAQKKLTNAYAALLQGKSFDKINYSNIINTLFAGNGSVFNKIVVPGTAATANAAATADTTYDFDAASTLAANTAADTKNSTNFVSNNQTFGTNTPVINVYFTKEAPNNAPATVNQTVIKQSAPAVDSSAVATNASNYFG